MPYLSQVFIRKRKVAADRARDNLAELKGSADPQTLNVLDEAGRLASVGTVETAFKSKAIAHRFASGVKRSEAELEDFARALESLKNAPSIPLDEKGRSLIKKCEETMKDIQDGISTLKKEQAVRVIGQNCRMHLRYNVLRLFAHSRSIRSFLVTLPLNEWRDDGVHETNVERGERQVESAIAVSDQIKQLASVKGFPGWQELFKEVANEFALCQEAVGRISGLGVIVLVEASRLLGADFPTTPAEMDNRSGQRTNDATSNPSSASTAVPSGASVASTDAQSDTEPATAGTTAGTLLRSVLLPSEAEYYEAIWDNLDNSDKGLW
ncbi:hypothetical protein QFC20_006678 [Naganishia adeliensis]|uniref:Uncharacterized protein n=1 Tax=Naganishia adeliensis TaxID=92952 RepID=A0ACC2V9T0_9TREE|nr:hypothetical protein QFC20_006678 [Naganishia adeliensis]